MLQPFLTLAASALMLGALFGLTGITLVFWHELVATKAISDAVSQNVLRDLGARWWRRVAVA